MQLYFIEANQNADDNERRCWRIQILLIAVFPGRGNPSPPEITFPCVSLSMLLVLLLLLSCSNIFATPPSVGTETARFCSTKSPDMDARSK